MYLHPFSQIFTHLLPSPHISTYFHTPHHCRIISQLHTFHTTITMISHIYLNTFHISLHISAHLHHLHTCAHISTQFCTFPHKLLKTWSRVQHVLSETKHLNCTLCMKDYHSTVLLCFLKQPPTSHSTDSTYKYMQFDK